MSDDEEADDNPPLFDINNWAALEEQAQHGMGILVPATQEETEVRLPFITKTSGKDPDVYLTWQVIAQNEILMAWMEGRKVNWTGLKMVETVLKLQTSKKGWRADAVRDMHMMAPKPQPKRSLVDALLGRK